MIIDDIRALIATDESRTLEQDYRRAERRYALGIHISQHLTEDGINRGGKLDAHMMTLDHTQAKAFLEHIADRPVPKSLVGIRAMKYVRAFILEGGFDIDQIP